MNIVRLKDAPPYQPKNHLSVEPRRLQGKEAGGPDRLSVALSLYPDGATGELLAAATELVYFVMEGTIELEYEHGTATLMRGDSVHIAAGEKRCAVNRSGAPAQLLVIQWWD